MGVLLGIAIVTCVVLGAACRTQAARARASEDRARELWAEVEAMKGCMDAMIDAFNTDGGGEYRELRVSANWLPLGTAVLAYARGGNGSGFVQPWFPRESALQLVELMPKRLTFDSVKNVVRVATKDKGLLEVHPDKITIDGEAAEAYAIGDGWCWEAI